ncbi:unnamed protein product [Phytophthora fragariaefolia]|uniref:Unnamed protein product n=1 Tax=Phytophthora fragariaefolia TaxID=1490495 RepID=A0A9W6U0S8_9STRA|nr:unnamed protein product [Phytophthora fragariaefolia]
MTRPYIRVTFVDHQSLTYMNPIMWTCIEFSNCSYWHKSLKVSWKNLSSGQLALFYESEKCASQGTFHYISDQKGYASGASNKFKKDRFISSMMLGEMPATNHQPTFTYISDCPKTSSGTRERGDNGSGPTLLWGIDDGSSLDGGLSSNWTDGLAVDKKVALN